MQGRWSETYLSGRSFERIGYAGNDFRIQSVLGICQCKPREDVENSEKQQNSKEEYNYQ